MAAVLKSCCIVFPWQLLMTRLTSATNKKTKRGRFFFKVHMEVTVNTSLVFFIVYGNYI